VGIAIAGNGDPVTPNTWTGTAADLLGCLNAARAGDKPKGWPNNARGLGIHLRRIAPAMRQMGLEVETGRGGGKANQRTITLRYTDPKDTKQTSETSDVSVTLTAQVNSVRTQDSGFRPTDTPDRPTGGAVPDVRTQSGIVGRKPDSTIRQENPFDIRHTDVSDVSDGVFPSLGAASGSEYTVDL
jgi:hypothetical protein